MISQRRIKEAKEQAAIAAAAASVIQHHMRCRLRWTGKLSKLLPGNEKITAAVQRRRQATSGWRPKIYWPRRSRPQSRLLSKQKLRERMLFA